MFAHFKKVNNLKNSENPADKLMASAHYDAAQLHRKAMNSHGKISYPFHSAKATLASKFLETAERQGTAEKIIADRNKSK